MVFEENKSLYLLSDAVHNLTNSADIISNEGFIENVGNYVSKVVTNFSDYFKNSNIKKITSNMVGWSIKLDAHDSAVIAQFDKDPMFYGLIVNEQIPAVIPPYFTGDYLSYAELLNSICEHAMGLPEYIGLTYDTIGKVVTSLEYSMNSFNEVKEALAKKDASRQGLRDDLASLYTGKVNTDFADFTKVFKSGKDVSTFVKMFDDTHFTGTFFNKKNKDGLPKNIIKQGNDLSALMIEFNRLYKGGEIVNVEKGFNVLFSKLALSVAEEMEFYALAYYQRDILSNSFVKTLDNILAKRTELGF